MSGWKLFLAFGRYLISIFVSHAISNEAHSAFTHFLQANGGMKDHDYSLWQPFILVLK
jgi:hypothetical protein